MVKVTALLIASGASAVAAVRPALVVWAGVVAGLLIAWALLSEDQPNR